MSESEALILQRLVTEIERLREDVRALRDSSWLTVADVCRMRKWSRRTLYRQIARGSIPPGEVHGGRRRWPPGTV